MTKIAVCSDLHLEFGRLKLDKTEGADVLILGGDICVAQDILNLGSMYGGYVADDKRVVIKDFFDHVSAQFPTVIYLAGNHEHYHGYFDQTHNILIDYLANYKNIHVLENETYQVKPGLSIYAGTMWTDLNGDNHVTRATLVDYLNDYRVVKIARSVAQSHIGYRLTPQDTYDQHKLYKKGLKEALDGSPDHFIVCSHHGPTNLSVHPLYTDDYHVNGGYNSNLSEFILDNPRIKLWTHGHTHHCLDYMIGTTRVVCNPRGYDGHEPCSDNFQLQYIEV